MSESFSRKELMASIEKAALTMAEGAANELAMRKSIKQALSTSESLARLWEVIGVGGSRLDRNEKALFITGLAPLGAWYSDEASLWTVMQWAWEESHFSEFLNTSPPLHSDNFKEILGAIVLSKADCWQAISEIAAAQLAAERGER